MNTSLKWIEALVPGLNVDAQEYTDAMILSGSKVEFYKKMDADLEKIVVGQIKKIEPHPDADKLIICQVDVGTGEDIQIVTGAPNVKEGDKVPVVLDGGRVAGGHDGKMTEGGIKIKKGKLRGIESNGMMCSIEELGSTRDMYPEAPEYGIYIFAEDEVKPGDDAIKALGLDDTIVEYEITNNRVDCFSILGIAREAAATFKKEFVPPVVTETGNDEDVNDYIKVNVVDKELCPRYTARVVKNIKIAPSPKWMQRRLAAQGIRPINNIVDITNYVMEEYGQPMHAYDWDTIEGKEIVVRRAGKGELFTTLDGQERTLDENVLMICDGRKAIGIAGIMGGENSMITDNVKTMLFEAACFDGTNIRLSGKKIGLRTDASSKFEKGLDPNLAMEAMNRACQLIEELGAGEVVGGAIDIYENKKEGRRIPFEPEKYNKLLGTNIKPEEMLSYFKRLELGYDKETNEVLVPSWRQDLECDADLAEEVARFFGYANIPTTLPSGEATTGMLSYKLRIEAIAREIAEFCGFSQGMNYSFESPKVFDKLLLPEDSPLRQTVTISNPLGEDFSIMRTTSLNGMLTSLSTNYNRRNESAGLFEVAKVYIPKALPLTELPHEIPTLTMGMYGNMDFYDLKGIVEHLMHVLGMSKVAEYVTEKALPWMHPGRTASVIVNGESIGYLGEVHPAVLKNYGIGTRAYLAVLDMEKVIANANRDVVYQALPKFPALTRDIAMLVKEDVTVKEIADIIKKNGGAYLEEAKLFDVYQGAQIEAGYKSVAYSITFRSAEKTLADADIADAMDKILKSLAEELGAQLRDK